MAFSPHPSSNHNIACAGELDGVRDRIALELREECWHDHNHVLHALAAACHIYRETVYVC